MASYILKRTDQGGGYAALPGSRHSYVKDALEARRFTTIEEAQRNRCVDNEVIIDLSTGPTGNRPRMSCGWTTQALSSTEKLTTFGADWHDSCTIYSMGRRAC